MKKVHNPLPRRVVLAKVTWAKDAKTVITADTKITICPPYKPRFEAISLFGVSTATQTGRVCAVDEEAEAANG